MLSNCAVLLPGAYWVWRRSSVAVHVLVRMRVRAHERVSVGVGVYVCCVRGLTAAPVRR